MSEQKPESGLPPVAPLPRRESTMSEMPDPLELFRQSLETQRQQIELSRIQVEKSAEFAHEALKADYADREKQRDHELKIQRNAMIFIISLVVVLLVLLMVAFVINKEAATEMVRAIGYLLAIGAAYIIGRYRGMKSGER